MSDEDLSAICQRTPENRARFTTVLDQRVSVDRRDHDGMVWLRLDENVVALDADEAWLVAKAMLAESGER